MIIRAVHYFFCAIIIRLVVAGSVGDVRCYVCVMTFSALSASIEGIDDSCDCPL